MKIHLGKISLFAGDFVPANWMLCNGQAVNTDENYNLMSGLEANSVSFEQDLEAGTFNLPQLDDIGKCRHLVSTTGQLMAAKAEEMDFIGFVEPMPSANVPANYLPCDGRKLEVLKHNTLFALLKTDFGGDGKELFLLPNLNNNGSARYMICVQGQFPPRS